MFDTILHVRSLQMDWVMTLTWVGMMATILVKVLVDGVSHFPQYGGNVGTRIMLSFVLAFSFFVLPNRIPALYWAWHSLWHLFMGVGYYELYKHLDSTYWQQQRKLSGKQL
eukprot:jgi/Chrzof1/11589/Cz06g01090.t1